MLTMQQWLIISCGFSCLLLVARITCHGLPDLYIPCVEPVSCIFTLCHHGMVMDALSGIAKSKWKLTGRYDPVAIIHSKFFLHTYRSLSS